MDSYLAGFLVGLLCVFAVGTILRLVRRNAARSGQNMTSGSSPRAASPTVSRILR